MALELGDGSRVAVVGGGPAGALVGFFLLDLAHRLELNLGVDIYEVKDVSEGGAAGCNTCGGTISEALVEMLALEGIVLPDSVVQRGIDSYVMHTDEGAARFETPLQEMRLAAVHRGGGPRRDAGVAWESFDGHLLGLAAEKGARIVAARVDGLDWDDGRPRVHPRGGEPTKYDLLIGAAGVEPATLKLFAGLGIGYVPPKLAKTWIAEIQLGAERVNERFGTSMHLFLLDIPRLELAALIPRGEFVTLCLLGDIDEELVQRFAGDPVVKGCFPEGLELDEPSSHCSSHTNVGAAVHPYSERVVVIGDAAVARLYKDGVGAAYRTSKACAVSAVFDGIAESNFGELYWRACERIIKDNKYGSVLFGLTGVVRRLRFLQRAMLRTVQREQALPGRDRTLSILLWDTFTGSSPYREVFLHALRPRFLLRFLWQTMAAIVRPNGAPEASEATGGGSR